MRWPWQKKKYEHMDLPWPGCRNMDIPNPPDWVNWEIIERQMYRAAVLFPEQPECPMNKDQRTIQDNQERILDHQERIYDLERNMTDIQRRERGLRGQVDGQNQRIDQRELVEDNHEFRLKTLECPTTDTDWADRQAAQDAHSMHCGVKKDRQCSERITGRARSWIMGNKLSPADANRLRIEIDRAVATWNGCENCIDWLPCGSPKCCHACGRRVKAHSSYTGHTNCG